MLSQVVTLLLKLVGCNAQIAITHLAIGEDIQVAQAAGPVSLLLGGHEHTPIIAQEDDKLIFKTGQNANWLGIVDLHIDVAADTDALSPTPPPPKQDPSAAVSASTFEDPESAPVPAPAPAAAAASPASAARSAGPVLAKVLSIVPSLQLQANLSELHCRDLSPWAD